jgi:uncharacterized protein
MIEELRPTPPVQERDRAFWSCIRDGQLVGWKCRQCGEIRLLPANRCAACLSGEYESVTLSGEGVIETACRFHRAYFKELVAAVPYTVVLVRLKEGPMLYSNLVDEPGTLPTPGTPVMAVLKPFGDKGGLILFEMLPA